MTVFSMMSLIGSMSQYYGSPCVYKAGWCVRQVMHIPLLMRANKLETAAVQGSLACLAPP